MRAAGRLGTRCALSGLVQSSPSLPALEDTTLPKATKQPAARSNANSSRQPAPRTRRASRQVSPAKRVSPGRQVPSGREVPPGERDLLDEEFDGELRRLPDSSFDEAVDEAVDEAIDDADDEADDEEQQEPEAEHTGGDDQIDDPVRIYLMQMGEIPMLGRRKEVAVAKRINHGRRRFRYCMLATDYMLQAAADLLEGIRDNRLRLDRTIEVSVINLSEKTRLLKVLAPNLRTLRHL